ncbi:hypothetical protein [Nocardioides montaniterrae]
MSPSEALQRLRAAEEARSLVRIKRRESMDRLDGFAWSNTHLRPIATTGR